MTDVIARFERGGGEEIRVSLRERSGEVYLDLRVHRTSPPGDGEAMPCGEGIRLPLELLDKLRRAIQALEEEARRRKMVPGGGPAIVQMVAGEPVVLSEDGAGTSASGRGGASHGERADARVPLRCPVEYAPSGTWRGRRERGRRQGLTRDISRAGLQALLPERVPTLSPLVVTLYLPSGTIWLPCEVVWAAPLTARDMGGGSWRHGLRFTDVGPQERRLLDRLVEQRTAREPVAGTGRALVRPGGGAGREGNAAPA